MAERVREETRFAQRCYCVEKSAPTSTARQVIALSHRHSGTIFADDPQMNSAAHAGYSTFRRCLRRISQSTEACAVARTQPLHLSASLSADRAGQGQRTLKARLSLSFRAQNFCVKAGAKAGAIDPPPVARKWDWHPRERAPHTHAWQQPRRRESTRIWPNAISCIRAGTRSRLCLYLIRAGTMGSRGSLKLGCTPTEQPAFPGLGCAPGRTGITPAALTLRRA